VWTWFGGQEYGAALANVLLGVAEPGGRLPTTFPADAGSVPVLDTMPAADRRLPYDEGILVGYRNYDVNEIEPAFCFGHGLGYTAWEYESVFVKSPDPDGGLAARVRVTNTGDRSGREVVQCYAEPISGATGDAPRRLVGFAGVELPPGESAEVAVPLSRRALSTYDSEHGWEPLSGAYRLSIGRSSRDLRLDAELEVAREM